MRCSNTYLKVINGGIVVLLTASVWGLGWDRLAAQDANKDGNNHSKEGSADDAAATDFRSDLRQLETRIQAVYRRVAPATVAVLSLPGDRPYGSGAIVDAQGMVLYTGHHQLETNTRVMVVLGDGRRVEGTILGVHEPFDISLIQLDGKGPWPHVELGHCDTLSIDDPCLAFGYPVGYRDDHGRKPEDDRPPLMRLGRVLKVAATGVVTSAQVKGGDSGGPLFTLDGELIGVHSSGDGSGEHMHVRVELYRQARAQLLAGQHVRRGAFFLGPFGDKKPSFASGTDVYKSIVALEADGKRLAFAVIVGSDGWIISKGSNCQPKMTCRLWNNETVPATLVTASRRFDLALVKIDRGNLPETAWSSRTPRPGVLVASLTTSDEPEVHGVIASPVRPVAAERGLVFIHTEANDRTGGIRVKEANSPRTETIFKVGDVITQIENVPTPSSASYLRERERRLSRKIVGETLAMTIERNGQEIHLNVPVESGVQSYWGRHSGFQGKRILQAA